MKLLVWCRYLALVALVFLSGTSAAQVATNAAGFPRHVTIDQRTIGVFFPFFLGNGSSTRTGHWTVELDRDGAGTTYSPVAVTVTAVAATETGAFGATATISNATTNSVGVRFDASLIPGRGGVPYLLPGETLTVSFVNGGGNILTRGSDSAPVLSFGPYTSKNIYTPSATGFGDIQYQSEGFAASQDQCSPVNTNFFRWTYVYSLRFRNSTAWTTANNKLRVVWGNGGSTSDLRGYLSNSGGDPSPTQAPVTLFAGSNPGVYVSFRSGLNITSAEAGIINVDGTDQFIYPDNTGFCNFASNAYPIGVTTAVYDASTVPTLQDPTQFNSFDYDDQNTGTLAMTPSTPPTTATSEMVCLGSNVGVRFTDASTFNCIGNGTALTVPGQGAFSTPLNNQQRWVRIIYGGANSGTPASVIPNIQVGGIPVTNATGALDPAWDNVGHPILPGVYTDMTPNAAPMDRGYVYTGGGADANGVITLPANAVVPNVVSELITTSSPTGQAVGQRFYVTLQYWGVCNPYPTSAPVEISVDYVEIITKPAPLTQTTRDYCHDQNMTAVNFSVTGVVGGMTAINWYNTNPQLGGAVLLSTGTSTTYPASPIVPNSVPAGGTYSVWATQVVGGTNACESDPVEVIIRKREQLTAPGAISITDGTPTTVCAGTADIDLQVPAAAGSTTIGGAAEYLWSITAGTATIDGSATGQAVRIDIPAGASGTQTLSVVRRYTTNDAAGNRCITSAQTFNFTVDPTTVGGTVSGTASICAGQSTGLITLSGHTGTIQRWEVNGVTDASLGTANPINPTINAAGTYVYQAFVKSGVCAEAGSTTTATITVSDVPGKPTVTPSATSTCEGSAISLTSSNVTTGTYAWFKEAAPWSPNNSATGLQVWLKADAGVTTTGVAVTNWADQSATGGSQDVSPVAAANRPNLLTAAQNGLNVIDFDGTDDGLRGALGNPGGTGASMTIITVAKSDINPQTGVLVDVSDNITQTDRLYVQTLDAANYRSRLGNNAGTLFNASSPFTNTTNYHIFHSDHATNADVKGSVDGVPLVIAAGSGTLRAANNFIIGRSMASSRNFNGQIAEVIIYNGVLSLADRQKVEGYLAHKWGLTANLPASHPYKNTIPLHNPIQNTASNVLNNLDTPAESGTYRVQAIGPASTSCVSEPSNAVTITVNPKPTAVITATGGSVCSGNPAPPITWQLTGTPPFDITYTVTHSGGTPIPPQVITGYVPTEMVAPYTFSIPTPNPPIDFGIATGNFTYQMTILSDANTCGATSLGTTGVVSIGGTAPSFATGPSLSVSETCVSGTGFPQDPTLVFTLDAGSASSIAPHFTLTYRVDGSADRTKTFATDAASNPLTAITFTDVELDATTPSPHVISLMSLRSPSNCQTVFAPINLNFTVRPLPTISTQPASTATCDLSNATFTVAATGTNLSYQWQEKVGAGAFVDIADGGVYSGATTAALTLTGAPLAMNSNQYRVVVTGFNLPSTTPTCPVTSNAATLTVNAYATITTHPANDAKCVGFNTSFTVAATGPGGPAYQWQQDPDGAGALPFADLSNGTVAGVTYSGVTTATLSVNSVTALLNGSQYRVRLTTTGSCALNSNAATLTVNPLPVVVSPTPALCEDTFGAGFVNNITLNTYSNTITGLGGVYTATGASAFQSIADDRRIDWFTNAARTVAVPDASDVDGLTNGAQRFYTVTVISTGCTTNGTITFTINSKPVANGPTYTFCPDMPPGNGAFSTTANINLTTQIPNTDILGAGPPANRSLTYHPTLADAQANTNAITTFALTASTNIFARVTNTLTGCVNTSTIPLVFQPRAANNQITDALSNVLVDGLSGSAPYNGTTTFCASNSLVLLQLNPATNPGASYNWTVPAPSYTVPANHFGPGDPAVATPEFELLTGTNGFFVIFRFNYSTDTPPAGFTSSFGTGIPIVATETLGTSCSGNPLTLTVNVTASPPAPVVTGPVEVCENGTATYTITSGAATTHTWSIPPGATITNSPTGSSINVQMSTFDGLVSVIGASGAGCVSPVSNVVNVDVIPKPSFTFVMNPICSGADVATGLTLTPSIAAPLNPADVRYNWEVLSSNLPDAVVGDVANGVTTINDILTNTTGIPGVVIYRVTPIGPAATLCAGLAKNITVTVNPEPQLNLTNKTICSGEAANYQIKLSPLNLPAATTFSWAAPVMSDLSVQGTAEPGIAQGAAVHINDVFTNTSSAAITATYVINAISGTCSSNQAAAARTVVITINPEPVGINTTKPAICSGAGFTPINPQTENINAVGGNGVVSSFTWTAAYGAVTGGAGSGTIAVGGSLPSETLVNKTSAQINVVYTLFPTSQTGTCTGSPARSFTITIPVNPEPVGINTTQPICSGSAFTINPQTNNINVVGGNSVISSFTWTATYGAVTGGAGSGVIAVGGSLSETLRNVTSAPINVVYVISPTSQTGSCTGAPAQSFTHTVTVNPEPVGINTTQPAICSGTSFTAINPQTNNINVVGGNSVISSFTWTAAYGAVTGGVGSGTIALGGSLPSETLRNVTGATINVVYTLFPTSQTGSCTGTPAQSFTITVPVNPEPVGINTTQPICSGSSFSINPQTNNINAVGGNSVISSFTWTAAYGAVTGGVGSGTIAVGGSLSETLRNVTSSPINVIYTLSPTSQTGSCAGVPAQSFTHTVTVNPEPVGINTTKAAICSGAGFTAINPQTENINPVGGNGVVSSFTWTAVYGAVTGGAGSGVIAVGGTLGSETLVNTTGATINVVYTLFPTSQLAGCTGTPARSFTITIPVNPEPVGINTTQQLCSGLSFTINPQTNNISVVGGNSVTSSFTWTAVYGAVTGGVGSGSIAVGGTLSETLRNVTSAPINVVYTIFPTAQTGSCPGVPAQSFTHTVTVNPEPVGINTTKAAICSGAGFTPINPQTENINAVGGNSVVSSFTWTAAYGAVTGGAGSGSIAVAGSLPSETLVNRTSAVINVVYTLFPTSQTGSCTGSPAQSFTITIPVQPEPVGINTTQSLCSGSSFTINPQTNNISVVGGNSVTSSFTWTAVYGAVTGGAGSGSIAVAGTLSETLRNVTGAPINVVYTLFPTSQTGSCTGVPAQSFTHTVTVNPEPVGVNTMQPAICSGTSFAPINPQTNNLNVFGGNGVVSSFTWTAAYGAVTGGVGSGSIALGGSLPSETLRNVTSATINVVYTLFPTSQIGTCTGTPGQFFTITIPVNPEPVGINTSQPLCSGLSFTINPQTNNISVVGGNSVTSSFTWSAVYGSVTGGIGGGTIAVGGSLSETLRNVTSNPINVVYTFSPTSQLGSCTGVPAQTFTHTVTVNPEPVGINTTKAAICSGAGFTPINPQIENINAVGGNSVTSSFTWTAVYGAVTGGAGSGSIAVGGTLPSETLRNVTSSVINVVYTLFPTSQVGSCTGVPARSFTITIPVNPEPVGINTTQTLCSGSTFTLNPQTNNINVVGGNSVTSSFTWTAVYGAVTGGLSSGSIVVGGTLSETLRNVTGSPINVVYTLFPTAQTGSCPGVPAQSFTHTVTVNPEPVGINTTKTAICSGAGFTPIDPQVENINAVGGNSVVSSFTWTAVYGAVTGGAGSGSIAVGGTLPSETLVNKTSASINVIYTLFPTSQVGSCTGTPARSFTITIPVSPEPVGINTSQSLCSGATFTVNPQTNNISVVGGNSVVSSFTWTAVYGAVTGGAGSGSIVVGGNLSETLRNVTSAPIGVVYTIFPTSQTGSCTGVPAQSFTHTVTVNPEPVGINTTQSAICSTDTFNINPQANNINVVGGNSVVSSFTWTAVYGAVTGGASSGNIAVGGSLSETLRNTTSATINVVYTLFPTSQAGGCPGVPAQSFTITIPVNPEPTGPAVVTVIERCSGESVNFDPQTLINNVPTPVVSKFKYTVAVEAGPAASEVSAFGLDRTVASTALISDSFTHSAIASNADAVVVYTITPYSVSDNCEGDSFVLRVIVHPQPRGAAFSEQLCTAPVTGTSLNHSLTSQITNGVASKFTYTFIPDAGNPTVLPTAGAPYDRTVASSANITDNFLNNTGSAATVTYLVTPISTAYNCVSTFTFTYTVTINSNPVGTPVVDAQKCSNESFTFDPQTQTSIASTFTWTKTYDAGIVAATSGSGTGTIAEKLLNRTSGNTVLNAVYHVTPTAGTCVGSTFDITVPIKPEPVMATTLNEELCSGLPYNTNGKTLNTNGISVAASQYIISALADPELTGTPTTSVTGLPSTAINADAFVNLRSVQHKVVYTVIPVAANACQGEAKDIEFKINPEPVIQPQTPAAICSDVTTGVVLGTNGVSVNAANYFITAKEFSVGGFGGPYSAVTPADLTDVGNAALASPLLTGAITADKYTNLRNGTVHVKYSLQPRGPSASGACLGDVVDIIVPVNPEPDFDDSLSPTAFCSDLTVLTSNPGFQLAVEATSVGAASYILNQISFSPMTAGASNQGLGAGKTATSLNGDIFTNTDVVAHDVDYSLVPVSAAGCQGNEEILTFTINPAPDVKPNIDKIVCNDANSTLTLADNSPTTIAAANYDIVSISFNATNLTANAGNAATGVNTATLAYLSTDKYHNTTNDPQDATYVVRAVSAAGCKGPNRNLVVKVEPTITAVPNNLQAQLCSQGSTNIELTSPTNPSPNPASATDITFSFTVPSVAGVVGYSAGSNLAEGFQIQQALTNNNDAPSTVIYKVTPRAATAAGGAGCIGPVVDVPVIIQPRPKLTASTLNVTTCEDVALAINLSSTSNPTTGGGFGPVEYDLVTVTNTSGNISGFTNPAGANFAKTSTISDVLVTTDLSQQLITYQLRPQFAVPGSVNASGFCVGTDVDINVTISPRARMTAIPAAQLCTGEQLDRSIVITEADPGNTVISWTASAPSNVTGASSGGGDLLSQIIFNKNADEKTVTYSFTTNSFGCTRAGTPFDVTVYPLPKLTGVSTMNICNNGVMAINLAATPGTNVFTSDASNTRFRWTVDSPTDLSGASSFAGPATSISQTLSNTGESLGTYTYSFTPYVIRADGQECIGQQDKIVSVNVAPQVGGTLFSSDGDAESYLCKGNKDFVFFNFDGLALFEAVYSDGTNDITLTKQGAIKVLQVNPTTTTTYTLKSVKDGFGCTINPVGQTVTVNVGETNADFSIAGPAIACSPYQVQFQHNQVANVTYTWKWFDGVADSTYLASANQNGQIVKHTFFNPSPNANVKYKVYLETSLDANYPGGCMKTTFKEVQVYPTVAPSVFPDKTAICSGEQVTFVNSTQGASGAGASNRWFYRVQGTTTELEVKTSERALPVNYVLNNTTSSNPIVFEIVYQSTNGNCPAPEVVTPITVYRNIDAKFNHTDPTVYVGGHSFMTVTNTSEPVDASEFRYEWDFGLDANPQASTGVGPFNLDYVTPGPKEVVLRATNIIAEGAGLSCADEVRATIQIIVPPLIADFTADPLAACFPVDVTITENLATGDVFEWRVYDDLGKTAAVSNANTPVFQIPNPGKYTIELTTRNSFTGDQKTALKEVEIFSLPVASFDMRPNVVYVPDTELNTFNFSSGATEYEWDFGDGSILFEEEPKYKYRIEGVYDVMLIAKNDHGNGIVCVDSLVRKVVAKQGGVTRVPNAFTPNPNGPNGGRPGNNSFNDVFLPQVKGAEEFNMQIFDRWGNLIFESNDSTMGWDGYDVNGKILPAGVYVYKLTLRLSDGQRTTQLGDITMIR